MFKYILLAFILSGVAMFVLSMLYKALFSMHDEKTSMSNLFFTLYLTQLVSYIAPFKTGTIIGKPLIFKTLLNVPAMKAISVMAFEGIFSIGWQTLFLFVFLLVSGLKIVSFSPATGIIAMLSLLVIMFFLAKHRHYVMSKMPGKLQRYFGHISEINFKSKKLLWLIPVVFLQLLLLPLWVKLASSYFNISLSYMQYFEIYWVSYMLGRLSFLPMGIGVKDATISYFLVSYGLDSIMAVKIVGIYRLFTLLPYIVIGTLVFIYYGSKYGYRFIKTGELRP